MRASMSMRVETVYGNSCEMCLSADLDNPHELTSRVLFTDMARLLRLMAEEVRAENEAALEGREPGGGQREAEREADRREAARG